MYDYPSLLIVAVLFGLLVVAIEVGFFAGGRYASQTSDSSKTQINTIQGSLLGVLALLLGFTFSLALQRYDTRSEAVVTEANAIGTTLLRSELLPDSLRAQSQSLLTRYIDSRIEAAAVTLDHEGERLAVLEASASLLDEIWQLAGDAAREAPGPITGLYIQSYNELVDAYGARDAALNRHVPEVVLFLLFGTFILTASLVGFSAGMSGARTSFATYVLMLLIIALVFIIIDLDRPRRGLIEVSQQSLVDLRSMRVYLQN